MDTFVQRTNIARFNAMLLTEDNPARQKILRELLAAQEADLIALGKQETAERTGQARPPRGLCRKSGSNARSLSSI